MYTEVRWLSRGKCLNRLFDLRSEVKSFLKSLGTDGERLINVFEISDFLLDFVFCCDITSLLNDLNLCLQGRNKLIFDLMHSINMFHMSRSSSDGEALNSNCVATPKPVGE